jgi:hypothetical protein
MWDGAATAGLNDSSNAMIPGSTIFSIVIVIPPYCSAWSQYPYPRDTAIAMPPDERSGMSKTDENPVAWDCSMAEVAECQSCPDDRFVRCVCDSWLDKIKTTIEWM